VLPLSANTLDSYLRELIRDGLVSDKSKMLFVDDGSTDGTFGVIADLCDKYDTATGLSYAPNRGMFTAIYAGLSAVINETSADIVITIDSDLQDDISAIADMVAQYSNKNCDIVYGVRTDRTSDSFLKRSTAENYYRFMNNIGVPMLFNHAEYRLMSRRVCEQLLTFDENMLYFRVSVQMLNYKSGTSGYSRKERLAGITHFNPRKMIKLALDSILTYSKLPFQICTFFMTLFGLSGIAATIWQLATAQYATATTLALLSVLLFGIAFCASYIGRVYRIRFKPSFRVTDMIIKNK
jgi:glycosyltransferase involved in cell wall biosynthesis